MTKYKKEKKSNGKKAATITTTNDAGEQSVEQMKRRRKKNHRKGKLLRVYCICIFFYCSMCGMKIEYMVENGLIRTSCVANCIVYVLCI